jgi:ferric-dicitrate binding protein FerR (iron transport regulator)
MAGNSTLRYDRMAYGKEQRMVVMRGKAFYQVVRNTKCPFTVQASKTRVTVLGTTFQVKENASSTDVHVMSGQVRFSTATGKNVLLEAGMTGNWAVGQEEISVEHKNDSNDLSWKTKTLEFKDTPLDSVINDLCEFYQVKIVNRIKSGDLKLTATFNDMSLEEVLKIINQTLDTRLEVASDSNK